MRLLKIMAMSMSLLMPLSAMARPIDQVGIASYYSSHETGHITADGQIYRPYDYTAASRTLPLGTVVKVINLKNKKSVIVRINDRGPYVGHRIIDISYIAAKDIGLIHKGLGKVKIIVIAYR